MKLLLNNNMVKLARILIFTVFVSTFVFQTVTTDDELYNPDTFVGRWYILGIGSPPTTFLYTSSCRTMRVIKRENDTFNIVYSVGSDETYEEWKWQVDIYNNEIHEIKQFATNSRQVPTVSIITEFKHPYELVIFNNNTEVTTLLSRNKTVSSDFWYRCKKLLDDTGGRLEVVDQENCVRPSARFDPYNMVGKWNVVGIGHPSDGRLAMPNTCMWLHVTQRVNNFFNIQSSAGRGSTRTQKNWIGLIHYDRIDEYVDGAPVSNRKRLSILDYDDPFDLVLFDEPNKVYWLMSRNTNVAQELSKKYENMFTKNKWIQYRINNENCQ